MTVVVYEDQVPSLELTFGSQRWWWRLPGHSCLEEVFGGWGVTGPQGQDATFVGVDAENPFCLVAILIGTHTTVSNVRDHADPYHLAVRRARERGTRVPSDLRPGSSARGSAGDLAHTMRRASSGWESLTNQEPAGPTPSNRCRMASAQ